MKKKKFTKNNTYFKVILAITKYFNINNKSKI